MALNKYISFIVEGERFDIDPDGQVPTINFDLEDDESFEQKGGATSFDISLPASTSNQAGFNTAQNPSVVDNSANSDYDRPRNAIYIANGFELLTGKFFLQGVTKRNGQVVGYKGKMYGQNGDWVIDLKEATIYDFIQPRKHTFDTATIINSWNFDGRNENYDYVYAPVRYRKPFGEYPAPNPGNPDAPTQPDDTNVILSDLKPSLSIYWLLYRGLKSKGYKIKSQFLDSDYFRRAVMPWTWGGFDFLDDSRWEPLKFLAKSQMVFVSGDYNNFVNFNAVDNVPGAYDNSGSYNYIGPSGSIKNMGVWTYLPSINLGKIKVNLSIQISDDWFVQNGADVELWIEWWKNGVFVKADRVFRFEASFGLGNKKQGLYFDENFLEVDVVPGDWVGVRVKPVVHETAGIGSTGKHHVTVEQFTLNYVRLTNGSTIDFLNYPKFKNYKWLDLLRGVIDFFNLQVNTDPVTKEVYIEPAHEYEINGTTFEGYHNRKQLDYSQKVDISKESFLETFSDYERELVFKFKEDSQDGGLKKIQDRNQTTIGFSKYVLPERFKSEKKDQENRFFAPTMHYEHNPFQYVTGVSPQLIAIIPENVSNTSSEASENIYQPKIAWYKGNVSGVGGWKFNGIVYNTLPFLFAVNYKEGGENDPVFSYADQKIGGAIGQGLLKKFYWQRLAILRYGKKYNPIYLKLNNYDACNFLHRESIIIDNVEYLLINMKDFNPVTQESTACTMWMFYPIQQIDNQNTYPSIQSVQNSITSNSYDVKYWPHKLLTSDILVS